MKTKEEYPVMYKGWIIRKGNSTLKYNSKRLLAYNYKTNIFLNPIYKNWETLKKVIDNIKE
tara:strand:- start:9390 stop:9572 length:183 start_codon:yes stop_codon:yes gene_type:complete